MNFTPKKNVGLIVMGILAIAAVGLIGSNSYVTPVPIAAPATVFAPQAYVQDSSHTSILPAVQFVPDDQPTANSARYQLASSWIKNKHWWRRNAPIVGGAGAGVLVGGLVGGPAGALVGGAAGGGGGYLYKRSRRHSRHNYKYR